MPTLTHVALQVQDIDRSVAFYTRYCGLQVVHDRGSRRDDGAHRVVWMAEPGHEDRFVFVLMRGDAASPQDPRDYGHLGFAVASREAVDAVAARALAEGCLQWPAVREDWPVGYYCGVRDPDGRFVEFSFGQPLGPGAQG